MKIRFYSILLPLFFFFGLATPAEADVIYAPTPQTEVVAYQPDWQVGDKISYKTVISSSYGTSSDPAIPPTEVKVGDFSFTSTYEVLSVENDATEFSLTFKNFKSPLYASVPPKSYTVYYKINSQGQVIQITHLEEWVKLFEQAVTGNNPNATQPTEDERFVKMIWLNLIVNYSNYSALPLSIYHGPHHSLYLGKDFSLGQPHSNPIKIHYPPLLPFTFHDIDLTLSGNTEVKENGDGYDFTSSYSVNKDILLEWSQYALDRFALKDEDRQSYQKQINKYKKDSDSTFSGIFTDTLKTIDNRSSAAQTQGLFTFSGSYKGGMDKKVKHVYQGSVKITTTLITAPEATIDPNNPQEKSFEIEVN